MIPKVSNHALTFYQYLWTKECPVFNTVGHARYFFWAMRRMQGRIPADAEFNLYEEMHKEAQSYEPEVIFTNIDVYEAVQKLQAREL